MTTRLEAIRTRIGGLTWVDGNLDDDYLLLDVASAVAALDDDDWFNMLWHSCGDKKLVRLQGAIAPLMEEAT